jgi:hypothetical protein
MNLCKFELIVISRLLTTGNPEEDKKSTELFSDGII